MGSLVSMTRAQKRRMKKTIQRGREGRFVRRAQVLLQLAAGATPTHLSKTLSVARSTIYRWVRQFESDGEASVFACHAGRPASTVDAQLLKRLSELVGESPRASGYLRSTWTSEMLAETLVSELGRSIHPSTVRRWLPRLGMGWRRARPTLCLRDPLAAPRTAAIKGQLAKPEPRIEVFFVDEVDIDLNPKIGFQWAPRGQQPLIPTPGQNQKRYLAGALHARTGRVDFTEGEHKNTDLFLRLLEHLRQTYRGAQEIVLIADNYIVHKSHLTQAWLRHNPKFRILFQPTYQPWLNDIEKLWKQLHDNITRNHRHPNIRQLMDAVRQFMDLASPFPGNAPSVAKFGSAI